MLAVAKSNIGLVRQTNEDSFECVLPDLFIVADGMGGHAAGEIASRLAVECIKNRILESDKAEILRTEQTLAAAVEEANRMILQETQTHAAYAGMGSTVSLASVSDTSVHWAHVGDSRIYLIRAGAITQITKDHSLVWDLVASGSITKEEALTHPRRNLITRAVGVEEKLTVDTGCFDLRMGDKLLLCTDGLTNMVSDEELLRTIDSSSDLGQALDLLVARAIENGGADNITALLVSQ